MKLILDINTGTDGSWRKLPVDVPRIAFIGVEWMMLTRGYFSDDHVSTIAITDPDLSVDRINDTLLVTGAHGKEIFGP